MLLHPVGVVQGQHPRERLGVWRAALCRRGRDLNVADLCARGHGADVRGTVRRYSNWLRAGHHADGKLPLCCCCCCFCCCFSHHFHEQPISTTPTVPSAHPCLFCCFSLAIAQLQLNMFVEMPFQFLFPTSIVVSVTLCCLGLAYYGSKWPAMVLCKAKIATVLRNGG